MNLQSIKNWFGNVDISHTDWRLRWPVMLLPFLLLGMLYFLFKSNQLNARYTQDTIQLQQVLQENLLSTDTATDAVNPAQALLKFRSQFGKLEDNARTLQQWLQQGRNTKVQAQQAGALVELTANYRNGSDALPNVSFWNEISVLLADLENAVIRGIINTPEARDMIESMRGQYAQLRSTNFVTPPINESGELAANSQERQQAQLETMSVGFSQLRDQRAAISSAQNKALVLAALSSALFGLLLWGMWRASKNRVSATAGRTRSEQGAILKLLDEISPLAQGDLRVRATVSEASTGAVADAFNFAVDELRRLVLAVTESADLVKKSVSETRESAHHLARASSVQSREIHRSSNYLNVMSDTMAQLSAHAVESSGIADLSVQQARAGNVSVKANVDGLLRIREQAEMTSRMMQRLVETSGLINERVSDIQAVAKRTDLLALNTTIRSAAQASNGRNEGVSQLGYDVAYLADTLGRASRDIASLSDLIQQDATITLASMAKTVTEVDDNQRTAKQASENLNEIDRVSNQLNSHISDIASKSLRQAGVVKQLSANMGVINNITRDSTLELQNSAKALEALQEMTSELRESVSDFKLPRETKPTRVSKKVARSSVTHA